MGSHIYFVVLTANKMTEYLEEIFSVVVINSRVVLVQRQKSGF